MLGSSLKIKPELPFEVEVQRSRRKSAVIYVRNGKAEVRVPNRTPNYWVKQFVQEKREWIEQQLLAEQQRKNEQYSLRDGTSIPYLGKPLQIKHLANARVSIKGDELILPADDLFTDAALEFHNWLKAQATDYIVPLANDLAQQAQVEHKLSHIKFKKTKSRWGHCTREGDIQFNWLIMLGPPEVVHYLIAHEVCHLVHMNHSRAYWSVVDSICPNRKLAQAWLRANEHKVLALH
ncbi:MAG: SprT family zinc-dependent metalloprotease [Pseudomonadota bacterium]